MCHKPTVFLHRLSLLNRPICVQDMLIKIDRISVHNIFIKSTVFLYSICLLNRLNSVQDMFIKSTLFL